MKTNEHHTRRFLRPLLLFLVTISALPLFAWSFQVSVNGNDVIVIVSGLSGSQCCAGATVDDPTFAGADCSYPCGVGGQGRTFTIPLTCNSVGSHTIYVYAADPATNGYEYKQAGVSITDPPGPTCPQFDLNVAGTKVLTHQYNDASGGTVPYPPGQTADSEIKVSSRRAPLRPARSSI